MIKLTTKLMARAILIISLMLPWATSMADITFEKEGRISSISISTFVVNGRKFRLAPGADLVSSSPKREKFSDFKKGDMIYFRGKVIGADFYVDYISYDEIKVPS